VAEASGRKNLVAAVMVAAYGFNYAEPITHA